MRHAGDHNTEDMQNNQADGDVCNKRMKLFRGALVPGARSASSAAALRTRAGDDASVAGALAT